MRKPCSADDKHGAGEKPGCYQQKEKQKRFQILKNILNKKKQERFQIKSENALISYRACRQSTSERYDGFCKRLNTWDNRIRTLCFSITGNKALISNRFSITSLQPCSKQLKLNKAP